MKFLLDTHTCLWLANGSPELSKKICLLFEDSTILFYLSVASLWEIAIKMSIGKLKLKNTSFNEFVEKAILSNGIKILDINVLHLVTLMNLPFHHRDPFDRLMIAQAQSDGLTIISKDKKFKLYDVTTQF